MFFALIVALITLRRLRTDYLAIVLISLSLVLYDFCNNYVSLFNGADGLYNVPGAVREGVRSHASTPSSPSSPVSPRSCRSSCGS